MKKFALPGILAVFTLFLPLRSQAQPLDVPFQILVTTTNAGTVTLSTNTFPSPVTSINDNVASYQWCVSRVIMSSSTVSTLTMSWSTSTLTAFTTDYVVTGANASPLNIDWPYRAPYCAPVGQAILRIKSSVSTAVLTIEGYLWKGWNP